MQRRARLALALAVPIAALALAAVGHGYVFFETEGGAPLRWKRTKTSMRTSTVEPDELDGAAIPGALAAAFAAWDATSCVPTVTVSGTTDATHGSMPATIQGPPDNILVFIETKAEWAALGHGTKEIAVTVVANNPATGEIVDADIEVNDGGFELTLDANPRPGAVDFMSTLVHESGHFFGLDHSPDRTATMFADYDPNDPSGKRTLAQDDIDGVCALYAIPFPGSDDGCAAGGGEGPALAGAALVAWRLAVRARSRRGRAEVDAARASV